MGHSDDNIKRVSQSVGWTGPEVQIAPFRKKSLAIILYFQVAIYGGQNLLCIKPLPGNAKLLNFSMSKNDFCFVMLRLQKQNVSKVPCTGNINMR